MAAMCFAYPDVDWSNFDQEFIEQNKELSDYGINFLPTQIESHDSMIRILDEVRHFTNLVSHVGRDDFWQYIMLKYVKQIPKENEVGSSTMPQKVNPTNAENAWANGETTASQAIGITQKLTVSIMQRDLSDSSTLRTIPMVFLHSYQAISEIIKLLGKIEVNEEEMRKDLDENPEIIAEAIQTVLRKNGYKDAYEIMKKLTRGKKVTLLEIHEFARNLEINSEDKQRLLELTPREYIGLSEQLVDMYVSTVFEKSNK
jgi:adenylosuccinate lyase